MKRTILLLAAASILAVPLAGCQPPPKHHHQKNLVTRKIYHFADGRSGYQGNDGIWWYWMMSNNGSGSTTVVNTGGGSSGLTSSPNNITIPESGARGALSSPQGAAPAAPVAESVRGGFGSSAQTYGMTGGQWAKGSPPTEEELAQATVTEETVVENENGQPETEAQAEAEAQAEGQAEGQAAEGGAAAPAEGGAHRAVRLVVRPVETAEVMVAGVAEEVEINLHLSANSG